MSSPVRALPLEQPRTVPRQPRGRPLTADRRAPATSLPTILHRVWLAAGTIGIGSLGIYEMWGVLTTARITGPQAVFLVLFSLNFLWISFAAAQATSGWVRAMSRRRRPEPSEEVVLELRTALLVPVYREDPAAISAALEVMAEGLEAEAPGRFAFFILSDTNRADAWIDEEARFRPLIEASRPGCPIYYRRRADNAERKAGNIMDWVEGFGAGYDAMIILDADSLMAPRTLITLAKRLQAEPGVGLIQTLPALVRAESLFGRMQQFANRCYGPIFGGGLAAWHGASSNYWGHNAIIRVRAFAEAARLPLLPGKPPWGGHVLSHDFVEAAFLRRAGWGVCLHDDLDGSYEEGPPSLMDLLVRDRRWCQGNLQHTRFLFAPGFSWPSRIHLAVGIMSYGSALLWFSMIVVGLGIAVQAEVTRPEYFATPNLLPTWPVFDAERAIRLFAGSMALVLYPKVLGLLLALLRPSLRRGFGGAHTLLASVFAETLLSALYAPVIMASQCRIIVAILLGRDAGWSPQRRADGSVPFGQAVRLHARHFLLGVGFTLLAAYLNVYLALWLLPITLGLLVAAPLSYLSAHPGAGRAVRRAGLLQIPEEATGRRPAVLEAFEARLSALETKEEDERRPLERLAEDPALCAWHVEQLAPAPTGFSPPLVLAEAKAVRSESVSGLEDWLTEKERLALLMSPNLGAYLSRLKHKGRGRREEGALPPLLDRERRRDRAPRRSSDSGRG